MIAETDGDISSFPSTCFEDEKLGFSRIYFKAVLGEPSESCGQRALYSSFKKIYVTWLLTLAPLGGGPKGPPGGPKGPPCGFSQIAPEVLGISL